MQNIKQFINILIEDIIKVKVYKSKQIPLALIYQL